jgi:sodium-dependent phosphate cotransporter
MQEKSQVHDSSDTDTIPSVSESQNISLPISISLQDAASAAWERVHFRKIGLFLISIFLFVLAIILMKDSARGISSLVQDFITVTNPVNCLGFGWLSAYLIMSGSPIAATALTFFDAGMMDKIGAFNMITGSRLGASFIVLFVGFMYVLRGRDRVTSLSMGLLSLTVTWSTYILSLLIGVSILRAGALDWIQLSSGALLYSITEWIFDPILTVMNGILPPWAIFFCGLLIIMLSFQLFDRCLPQMTLKESQVGQMSRLVYRRWVMFSLGALITMVSMSVSLSLSVLVPLSNRGFVRRENVIPYIMGANITTFIDTLLAAVLLNNASAFTIVFVEMVSISLVSMIILATIYNHYERTMLDLVAWITAGNMNLVIFMSVVFVVPIFLMVI